MALLMHYTALTNYRRCPYRYHVIHERNIRRRTTPTRIVVGSALHQLMAALYRHLKDPAAPTWRDVMDEVRDTYLAQIVFEEEAEDTTALMDRLDNIMTRYEQQVVPTIIRPGVTILHVEEQLTLPPWVITPDLVVRQETPDGGAEIVLYDHKCMQDIPHNIETALLYDEQFTMYLYVLRSLYAPLPVRGVHDLVRTRVPAAPAVTKAGKLSRQRILTDRETVLRAVEGTPVPAEDVEEYLLTMPMTVFFQQIPHVRNDDMLRGVETELQRTWQELQIRRIVQYWPRHMGRECVWCPVRELCLQELVGADTTDMMSTIYRYADEPEQPPADVTEISGEGGVL